MKRMLLMAIVLACSVEARAAESASDIAMDLCIDTGGPWAICYMKHNQEERAVSMARAAMRDCATEAGQRVQDCPKIRAYIKQRWGY